MSALRLGVRAALETDNPSALVRPLAAAALACALSAWLERTFYPTHAVDRALLREAFGLWLPLAAYAAAERICRKGRLESIVVAVPRYGGSRRASLAGAVLALGGVLAASGASLAAITVAVAHGPGGLPWLNDFLLSSWLGALGGVSYAAWLSLASGFGRSGRRGTFLVLDLIFGSMSGAWALPFPRAHLRNLLGGAAPLELSQALSAGALAVLSLALLALTLARVPD